MSRKVKLLIIFFICFLILIISVRFFIKNTTQENPPGTPPLFSPNPNAPFSTIVPSTPPSLKQYATAQGKYAEIRQTFLQQKPWVLDMPIKAATYYIFYDAVADQVIVKLYSSTTSSVPVQDQLSSAKQQALDALKKENIDPNTQQVVFVEKAKPT